MALNTLTDAPVGCRLRSRGLNVATREHIRLDAFVVVVFGFYSICLSLFPPVKEGKDKLKHAGSIVQNTTRFIGQ